MFEIYGFSRLHYLVRCTTGKIPYPISGNICYFYLRTKLVKMKRHILVLLFGGIFLGSGLSQEIELTGFGGYMLNTDLKTYYGDYKLDNNLNYGAVFGYGLAPDLFVELTYNRQDTKVQYYYQNANEPLLMSTEYYHIGTQKAMGSGNVKPFGAFSLGASRFYLKESYGYAYEYAEWALSFALGLGTKVIVSHKLGFRLQARMGVPMIFNELWVGTADSRDSFLIPVWQFDLSAGVILRLGS